MDAVALVSSEQQKFQKSVKGIQKLLKSGKIKPRTDKDAKKAERSQKKRKETVKKFKKKRGLVYISHIPHGFYENEMTQYFRQFGVVTNVRVLRSSRTGRSKGAAFVEFLLPAVAEIVAETMNNYLMGKRLLKAEVIPLEKQRKAFRKNWNDFENPSSELRRKTKKEYNADETDEDHLKQARQLLKNLQKTKKKLKEAGIDYDFFKPVDVPPQLLPLLDAPVDIRQTEDTSETKQPKKESKKIKEEKKEKMPKFEGQDFIKIKPDKKEKKAIKEESESEEFDSDAFELELQSDEEFSSEEEDDKRDGDSYVEDMSEEEEEPLKKIKKNQPVPKKIEKKQNPGKKIQPGARRPLNQKLNKNKKNKK